MRHSSIFPGHLGVGIVIAALLPAAGCSGATEDSGDGDGDGDNSIPPPLNTDALLTSLDEAGRGDVCDAIAHIYGGYEVVFECPDGINTSPAPSEERCLTLLATLAADCGATVEDTLNCAIELSSSCTTNDCSSFFACTR